MTIAKHSTAADCWLLVENRVYDVTSILQSHPGGQDIIISYCGKEATQAFNTQDGQGSHSSSAQSQLTNYFIGTLGTTITAGDLRQSQQNINQAPPLTGGEEEDEDD